jgi:hypothetical protein
MAIGSTGTHSAVKDQADHNRYRLRAGAYAGTVVHLGLPGDDAPYLWFRSGEVVVTLSGAATSRELIAAAESLTR